LDLVVWHRRHDEIAACHNFSVGAIYGTLLNQANLLAFIDIFRTLALLCLMCAPLALLY